MDPRLPDRFDELLTRAFDDEASPAEREELAELAGVEPRLAALTELRAALCDALAAPGPVDVAGEVMAMLASDAEWAPLGDSLRGAFAAAPAVDLADAVFAGIHADAEWAPVGAALREAVAAPPLDIADAVMAAVNADADLSAYFDGELPAERAAAVAGRLVADSTARQDLAAFAEIGESLRGATARGEDLWPGIADGIGVDRDAIHGWDAIATPLREAFAALPEIDVASAVMAAIEPARTRMPLWVSFGGPMAVFAAAAAAIALVTIGGPAVGPVDASASLASVADFRLAAVNDAQVEALDSPVDVVVQVMQFEDGGPTFILVDDTSSGTGVPL